MKDQLTSNTLAFVLAGGAGRRLSPLTKYRPKPLVPFGGCFRILDFTLSNCFNSGLDRAYVLTQHESESLAAYLRKGWNLAEGNDREFAVPCPPTPGKRYAGTADAVLQNLCLLQEHGSVFVLVVSADHVYKMDYRRLLGFHAASGAEATIATVDHPKEFSSEMGVLEVGPDQRVVYFEEKPRDRQWGLRSSKTVTVNMGVYVFNAETLVSMAATKAAPLIDIGQDLIPRLLRSHKVNAYRHEDREKTNPLYWRDVGTVESYYGANMDLLMSNPPMDPFDGSWPIRSAVGRRLSGASLLSDVGAEPGVNSVIPRAADIAGACVYRSVLSPGVVLESGVAVRDSVLLPGAIVRRGASVRHAIIDANVVIEAGARVGYNRERDQSYFHMLSNGVVVVSPDYAMAAHK